MDKEEVIKELERLGFKKQGNGSFPYVYRDMDDSLGFYSPKSSTWHLGYNKIFFAWNFKTNTWDQIKDQSLSISDMIVLYG